jgi:hypothetical protein
MIVMSACARPGLHRPTGVLAPLAPSKLSDLDASVLLIGDAGAPGKRTKSGDEPVFRAASAIANEAVDRTTVIFLGDNIYDNGMPPDDASRGSAPSPKRLEANRIIDEQIRLAAPISAPRGVPTELPRIFVPGNHDWNDRGLLTSRDGFGRIRAQSAYIAEQAKSGERVEMLPANGCPGPSVRDVGRWLRIIAIDTEWWLLGRTADAASCSGVRTRADVMAALSRELASAGDRRVIVVAHHPLATGGPHGGKCSGIGCLVNPFRIAVGYFGGRQDLTNRQNRRMRRAIENALSTNPPIIYAAGHEHALQLFRGGAARLYAVSGSGTYLHTSPVGCRRASLFAEAASGFMRVESTSDGRVRLTIYTAGEDGIPVARQRIWATDANPRPEPGSGC